MVLFVAARDARMRLPFPYPVGVHEPNGGESPRGWKTWASGGSLVLIAVIGLRWGRGWPWKGGTLWSHGGGHGQGVGGTVNLSLGAMAVGKLSLWPVGLTVLLYGVARGLVASGVFHSSV